MTVSEIAPKLDDLEQYRRELTAHCYRMLGSGLEAEDAVQETMLKAWRSADRFEGRASVRTWMYRIATNVCLDMHRAAERRARPMELGPASPPTESALGPMLPEATWISPVPDALVVDPADVAASRDTVRLAFVTALQHLPARQRAVLLFCEVLRWQASEVASLLDTSVPAVNSALQRARTTLADLPVAARASAVEADNVELLASYVDAFERYDIDKLVTLLHDDAIMSMPPFAMWIRGAGDIGRWMVEPGPKGCKGSRLVPTSANGCPAFGQYRIDPAGGHAPWALQVLDIEDGRISGFHSYLDPALFELFGLPAHL